MSRSAAVRAAFDTRLIPIQMNSGAFADIFRFSWRKVWKSVQLIVSAVRALATFRPQVVYISPSIVGLAMWRDLLLGLAARFSGAKVVFHIHMRGLEANYRVSRVKRVAYRLMFRDAEVVHPAAELYDDLAVVVAPRRFHVVANGVADPGYTDTDRPDPETPRLLFLSNLFVDKGPLDLLRASEMVARKGLAHRLSFLGAVADPSVEAEISAADQQCGRVVERLGPLYGQAKTELMRDATIFVFPSYYRYEVQPLSIIEALSLGLPVIASNIAGIPSLIEDGREGLLVPPRDVDALATAIERLLRHQALRMSMSKAARRRYETSFTLQHFEARLTAVLADVAAGTPASSK